MTSLHDHRLYCVGVVRGGGTKCACAILPPSNRTAELRTSGCFARVKGLNERRKMKSRKSSSGWLPLESVAFRWLLVPRLLGAFLVHISDCDETYNYWEPVR